MLLGQMSSSGLDKKVSDEPGASCCGKRKQELREYWGASLVAQRLRIRLPVHGTRVRDQVREDPTCRGATKPVHHDY